MTEDDTFNRLRRTPINEIAELIWLAYLKDNTVEKLLIYFDRNNKVSSRDSLLKEHGWTIDDYLSAIVNSTEGRGEAHTQCLILEEEHIRSQYTLSEDDTFKKLRQSPIQDVYNAIHNGEDIYTGTWYIRKERILKEHGYTLIEYEWALKTYRERNDRR